MQNNLKEKQKKCKMTTMECKMAQGGLNNKIKGNLVNN